MRNLLLGLAFLAACSSDSVSSSDDARRAYIGLDLAVDRALNLGIKGYNESTQGANIPTETANGDVTGTLTVTGKVSQGTGSSGNSEMTLATAFATYEDRVQAADANTPTGITYNTDASALPALALSLRDIPLNGTGQGTFTGTMTGKVHMTGDLKGDVTLNLSFTGNLIPIAGMTGKIQRMPGSTHITGTATSDYGTFTVDITR